MNFKQFFKITKMEITFLVDLVAVAAFFSDPEFSSHYLVIIPLLISGSLASMSAAVFNNIYDMDIDREMKRTRYRESIVNSRTYTSTFIYGAVMLIAAMAVATIAINPLTSLFIFLGFLSYVVLYTIILKRRTTWNIVIGGIAGSFPAFAGWAAVSNDVSVTALFIAFLVFLWTPTHFWALATNSSQDYLEAGIPMLPAVVGVKKGSRWILINSIILVAYSLIPLWFRQIHVGVLYFAFAAVMGGMILYYVIRPMVRNYSLLEFRKAFHFSNYYLMLLLIAICLVSVVRL